MENDTLVITVDRLTRIDNGGKLKAFCDLLFGNLFLIKGFRLIEGEKGMFIGMPQQRSSQGKWFDIFSPATKELREYLNEIVIQAYNKV